MIKSAQRTGWSRHQHFGLRKEWLQLYFKHPHDWEITGGLGNRQEQSLSVWLKTVGILDGRGRETFLADLFRERGLDDIMSWEVLWVNVVFHFPTAAWYVEELGLGSWSTGEIKSSLHHHLPQFAFWTINNAVLELVGLLERTPVGKEINQGEVVSLHPRQVKRKGHAHPSDQAVCYAACRLFQAEKKRHLSLREKTLWPWVIFGCDQKYVFSQLLFAGKRWFEIDEGEISIKYIPEEWKTCGSMLTI